MAAPQLPGYHYDPETKKYYKVLTSSRQTPGSEKFTKSALGEQRRQEARAKRSADEEKSVSRRQTPSGVRQRDRGFVGCVIDRSPSSFPALRRQARPILLSRLRPVVRELAVVPTPHPYKADRIAIRPGGDVRASHIYVGGRIGPGTAGFYTAYGLAEAPRPSRPATLEALHTDIIDSPVSRFRFATRPPPAAPLLVLSCLGSSERAGQVLVRECAEDEDRTLHTHTFADESVWDADLFDPNVLVVASAGAVLEDVSTATRWRVGSYRGDVMSLAFAKREGIILCGTRNGSILCADARARPAEALPGLLPLRHGSAVTEMRVLRDENYLVSCAMDGSLLRWDRRMGRVVRSYCEGLEDEHFHMRFALAPDESVVVAGCTTVGVRVWDVQSGAIQSILRPPSEVRDKIICTDFHDMWQRPARDSEQTFYPVVAGITRDNIVTWAVGGGAG